MTCPALNHTHIASREPDPVLATVDTDTEVTKTKIPTLVELRVCGERDTGSREMRILTEERNGEWQ